MYRSIRSACFVGVLLLATGMAVAADPARSIIGERDVLAQAASANPVLRARLDQLRGKAREDGEVEVIVGVRAPFAPEGVLTASERSLQRRDIATRQGRVLRALPAVQSAKRHFRQFNSLPFMAMTVTPDELEALANHADTAYLEEVRYMSLQLAKSTAQIGASSAGGAWEQGFTGRGVTVAILDTGVESNHPFLAGSVVSEACYASDGNCPGGSRQSILAGSGQPCGEWFCNHGSHVAGIAAGNGATDTGGGSAISSMPSTALAGVAASPAASDTALAAGPGYSGVAPEANVIAINIFRSDGWVTTTDLISALQRVYELRDTHKIAAVNLSIGYGDAYDSEATCDADWASTKAAIDQLRSVGIATVIAAGNDGWYKALSAPGCISSGISVGAAGYNYGGSEVVAWFSNAAPFLKLLAPGDQITSSVPGGNYALMSGTSMATPHVVGAWALMKQKNPDLTVDQGLQVLRDTGRPISHRNGQTYPRIDIGAALQQIADTAPPATPAKPSATVMGSDRIDLTWTFVDNNVGVDAYKVYRNGTLVATMQARVNRFSNSGLQANTQYSYTVAACDAEGNCSAESIPELARTAAPSDSVAPTPPGNLTAKVYGSNRIDLIWKAATDNVGVKNYKVYRDGWLMSTLGKVTSYRQLDLQPARTYRYAVAACDAAGNCSARSEVVATTLKFSP